MVKRLQDNYNHPMLGKNHNRNTLKLISKPGKLNPMFGKKHNETTKKKIISDKISKYLNGVGIYDLDDNLVFKFKNNSVLVKYLKISRVTVGKSLKSGQI